MTSVLGEAPVNTIFAGFVDPRPYPITGLTSQLWIDTVPVVNVRFKDLWLTQAYVRIDMLFLAEDINHSWSGDPYPHVVEWEGKLFLEDGHNRITRAALRGHRSMRARVFDNARIWS